MGIHNLQILAGFTSSLIFVSGNFPMLLKAIRTKNLHSYSPIHLTLGNLGNYINWIYVSSLPFGPVYFLQAFFTLSSTIMLVCYLRYEVNWSFLRAIKSRPNL